MSQLLKYDSNFFWDHKHINIYMDTNPDHFTPLVLHVRGNERMTVVLYDRTSSLSSVLEELFCRCNRAINRIPPTQNALLQHSKCAVYQKLEFGPQEQAHNKIFKDLLGTWNQIMDTATSMNDELRSFTILQ